MNDFAKRLLSQEQRLSWFEKSKALKYIKYYLKSATKEIRIATGFFTIRGWGLLRGCTKDKNTYLLVGIDEPGEQKARLALIKEIMLDLRTGIDRERRQVVLDLVEKMQSQEFQIVDARATDHHAKLYIADQIAALVTSSNLTGKGLMEQIEAGNVIIDSREITALIQEFDEYFKNAKDLTQELLEIFQKWLQFVSPWDIYLKTMLALENFTPAKSRYTKKPVSYQMDMIAETLRHIEKYSGSMLVASTGLGKTVVAVHVALHLREKDLIDNVMVIGPKAVRSNWQREMRAAGLPCEYFVRQAFDKKSADQDSSLELFDEIQKTVEQQRWFLIIDESHEFRNRFKQDLFNMRKSPEERLAFKRLRKFSLKGTVKVLLLTGSPYARDIDNINSQLFLLPHTAESQALLPEYIEDAKAWHVNNTDEFVKLDSVVSQLTTPHVARYYGQKDGEATYITFGDERKYIPKVILYSIPFSLICETELSEAILNGYFDLNSPKPMFRELFRRLVRVAWTSSPLALRGVLESIVDTPDGINSYKLGKLQFSSSRPQRQAVLNPIITQLKSLEYNGDIKLKTLSILLQEAKQNLQKVIIFCERRATVVYLVEGLQKLIPELQVIATIKMGEGEHQYEMKETKEIEKLIKQFAPLSNHAEGKYQENYDVFISTDAHGVGVDMQDAAIVINYDIDWTPIGPVQRAGRILRFWHSPRPVGLYTFVPTLTSPTTLKYDLVKIQNRWEKLIARHKESKKIIDLPVLTTADIQEINLLEIESKIIIKYGELDLDALADLDISPYYQHTAKLQLNRDYAKTIADDILSAKTYLSSHPSLFVLLLYKQQYHGVVYNVETQEIKEPSIVKLLDLIACTEETEIAPVDYDIVEKLCDICLQKWCSQNNVSSEDVERICTLYLYPQSQDIGLENLLS